MATAKIIDERETSSVQYKDLLTGEIFEVDFGVICMKTGIVIDTGFANPEFYAIRLSDGESLKFPLNYAVKRVNCEIHIN